MVISYITKKFFYKSKHFPKKKPPKRVLVFISISISHSHPWNFTRIGIEDE